MLKHYFLTEKCQVWCQTGQTGWVKSGKTDYPTQPNPFGTLDGDNCQRLCSSVGKYNENCKNYNLRNNLKNGNDMHHCSVRVISKCQLS
ncbi:hypothetical protein RhiirA5_424003 [Rhizophagus irregularis]|uniref:Uncharacterized protein n=1 Tax=Rhizophagus irregularis TaxID=588596 RepID=A0A2N0P8Z3_9GLOM|nr:hypothetical protein RhiirA5_424003 [Rhizophagus irregularis]